VVKAHPAHPGTAEIVAQAIVNAAHHTGMPEGVFSILFDDGISVGEMLVRHAGIKAVGFTGSRGGGLALWRIANERETPIPVYAEMGSVNPTVVLSGKLNAEFAAGLHQSSTMGVGQFCTNPGLVITIGDSAEFLSHFNELMRGSVAGTMLTDRIAQTYIEGVRRVAQAAGVAEVRAEEGTACVMEIDADKFLRDRLFQEEIFGPYSLIVACKDEDEAIKVIRSLEGQLTGSIHGSDDDLAHTGRLVAELEEKVGRLIVNQFPTGVEVNSSMVHGGPFPATTDSRTTSVGARAITRWARPVCYQNLPEHLLPERLKG
jgi:NADP-dependent aldehyde dehydrogenase